MASCGKGTTDSPPLPLTTAARVEVQLGSDSLLVGDSIAATARGVNSEGTVVPLSVVVWSTADSSIGSVSAGGVLRARNVGTARLDVLGDGAVGSRTVRIVPRELRVRVVAPDTAQLVDDIPVSAEVETPEGVRLSEVAPRFAVSDPTIATIGAIAVGKARVSANRAGVTELLAIVGRDTTRRRFVVRLTPLRSLTVSVDTRVIAVGDSAPYTLTAIDSGGRAVPTRGTDVGVEPAGAMLVRNGFLIATSAGRVELRAINGSLTARDTVTGQPPSEFPLEIVDGDGQNPLPLRVVLSMERVAVKWRRIIRSAPAGETVRLQLGECRNAVPVSQFISGVRVLVKIDSLRQNVLAQGGPCVMRPNGLPLLGTIQLNYFYYNTLSDRKLDDLIMHEVGHVLGIGSLWGRGQYAALVVGDSNAVDPIFVGPNTLGAFARLGGSARFTGRRVPIEIQVLGHWRTGASGGELMAPSLTTAPQPTSAVTVAALRDLGWNVEPEAYEEYQLPSNVLAGLVSPRVATVPNAATHSLGGDVLLPQMMILPGGRQVRLDPSGRPILR